MERVMQMKNLGKRLLATFGFGMALLACDPPVTDEVPGPGTDTTAARDSAWMSITNQRETDPQTLTFHLFRANAQTAQTGSRVFTLGRVPADSARQFRVPAGNFKLAYEEGTRNYVEMSLYRHRTIPESEWPVFTVKKDSFYFLFLKTDGNEDDWDANNFDFVLNR